MRESSATVSSEGTLPKTAAEVEPEKPEKGLSGGLQLGFAFSSATGIMGPS
jgi:hypothetical protein